MSDELTTYLPGDATDWLGRPVPPFVQTKADLSRWDVILRLCELMWRMTHDGEDPPGDWMWFTPRSMFQSDVPTGTPDEAGPEGSVERLVASGKITPLEAYRRATAESELVSQPSD